MLNADEYETKAGRRVFRESFLEAELVQLRTEGPLGII